MGLSITGTFAAPLQGDMRSHLPRYSSSRFSLGSLGKISSQSSRTLILEIFAREVTEALLWVYEKEKEHLQCMAEEYCIFSVIGTRRILIKDNLMLYMAGVRSLGGCAIPPDNLADPHSNSTNEPTAARDHLPDVTAESLNKSPLSHP